MLICDGARCNLVALPLMACSTLPTGRWRRSARWQGLAADGEDGSGRRIGFNENPGVFRVCLTYAKRMPPARTHEARLIWLSRGRSRVGSGGKSALSPERTVARSGCCFRRVSQSRCSSCNAESIWPQWKGYGKRGARLLEHDLVCPIHSRSFGLLKTRVR